MYSFAQHDEVKVVDEPLYGHYLRVSGALHPGRDKVLQTVNCDGDAVMRDLLAEQGEMGNTRLFMKHMAHHLVDLDLDFLRRTQNILLVRNPREMLPSLTIQLPDADLGDTGLQQQWDLYMSLDEAGQTPTVLDSRELLMDPEKVLRQLCQRIDLSFTAPMLHWEAGPASRHTGPSPAFRKNCMPCSTSANPGMSNCLRTPFAPTTMETALETARCPQRRYSRRHQ
jgi:hypothetical protein